MASGTANIVEQEDAQDDGDDADSPVSDMDIDELNEEDIAVKVKVEKLAQNTKFSQMLNTFDFDIQNRSHRSALSSLMDELRKVY